MKRFRTQGHFFVVEDTETGLEEIRKSKDTIYFKENEGYIHLYNEITDKKISQEDYTIGTVINGEDSDIPFSTLDNLKSYLSNNIGSDTSIITSPLMIVKASKIVTETTIATLTSKDDYIISVADGTSFAIGQYLTVYNQVANRVFFATVKLVTINNITLDSPLDFEFEVGSFVSVGDTNMNVDGSVTPVIFGIRNPTGVDIPLTYQIKRLMFNCLTTGVVDLGKFGDIAGKLTRGLVARKVDGTYRNIFNVKSNAEMKNLMYDFDIEVASGNAQDGFTGRLTLSKLGSSIILKEDEDLQFLVQDDLQTLLSLEILAEGNKLN